MTDALSSPQTICTVSELNRMAKSLLERGLPLMWVSGEISNLTVAASGHCYFSLKDAAAQVRCVMFRNRAVLLPFKPREGMKIEARALATLYEGRGEFQLNIEAMRPSGIGALFEAFEQLKRQLAAAGLFEVSRKKSLPTNPRSIGIVTSPQAAALRDVLTTLKRRAPHIPIVLYPTPVQGDGSAEKIAAMIRAADARHEVDVLIVCRGGGSIEDLWAFNEAAVAYAIADCRIPVVSGVGHETDFTITDFVADMRAATPTAAAEMVSADQSVQRDQLRQQAMQLSQRFKRRIEQQMQRLDYLSRRLVHPRDKLQNQTAQLLRAQSALRRLQNQTVERTTWRLSSLVQRHQAAKPNVMPQKNRLQAAAQRLKFTTQHQQIRHAARIDALAGRLQALNPTAVLARGYSLVETDHGALVRDVAELRHGQHLVLRFANSEAGVIVTEAQVEQGDLF